MRQFTPGELVAERFRIVRFIAEGGMGQVYEAEDLVLGEAVALKFLSQHRAGNAQSMERFRREIQLARKVTHPNVCRTFDVFLHDPGDGEPHLQFVTLELLRGETLEEYLRRRGQLQEKEALPLVRQMANALAAAHDAGIIHRDFKTGNVILVPSPREEGNLRAVITDFGLARPTAQSMALEKAANKTEDDRTPLTGEGAVVGTADTMAPEQLLGDEITPAVDLYAFGVVIYEMVTGAKPYPGGSLVSVLARRVSEPPTSPREHREDLDEDWERVILQCLERNPKNRPKNPQALLFELMGQEAYFSTSASTAGIPRPSREVLLGKESQDRRLQLVAALVTTLGLALFLGWWLTRSEDGPPTWSGTPSPLTRTIGLELDPAFSPDGSRLAYSSDAEGSFELWIQELESQQPRRLTDQGGAFEPSFSPDGQTLAYHSKTQGGIWRLDVVTSESQQLTSFGSRPDFSPDGTSLVFQSESSPQLAETSSPALGLSTLWQLDLKSGESQQLTLADDPPGGHATPAFSPDGRSIVFASSHYGRSSIWRLDLESGQASALVEDPVASYDPVFAPDGRSIYFSAITRQVYGLWRQNLSPDGEADGEPIQIHNLGLASIRQIAIAPNGRGIAYTAMQTTSDLWSLPLTPGSAEPAGPALALTHHGGRNNRPTFSPDGSLLAFDHWQLGFPIDLWLVPAAGGRPQRLTTGPGDDRQAQWLSEQQLVYWSGEGEEAMLRVLDPQQDTPQSLPFTTLPEGVVWATLSPQGEYIAYHAAGENGARTLWLRDVSEGLDRQLVHTESLPGFDPTQSSLGFPVWSNDGLWIAFQMRQGENRTHVMVVSTQGEGTAKEPRQLTFGEGENWPYSFSPDGEHIAFAALRNGEWNLWAVSRQGGEQTRLTTAPPLNRYVRYPTWSPRGDQLVYEQATTVGDIFLLAAEDS